MHGQEGRGDEVKLPSDIAADLRLYEKSRNDEVAKLTRDRDEAIAEVERVTREWSESLVAGAKLRKERDAALADAARLRAAAIELFEAQENDDRVTEAWLETDEQDREADAAKDASRVRVTSALKELRATIGDVR